MKIAWPSGPLLVAAAAGFAFGTVAQAAVFPAGTDPAKAAPAPAKQSSLATTQDLRIHYEIHGRLDGPRTPLLVLHGAYMSADAMAPFVSAFARTRPVIVMDMRGHGRTGDAPGPLTYEAMADDAAAVLDSAGVTKVDLFGYSMGGGAAIQLAIRHPARVGKLVTASASTRLDALYPEVAQGIAQITPDMLGKIRVEYERLAPRPEDFPRLVDKLKALDAAPFDWDASFRRLRHPTMIVMGDYDVLATEHAVEMFRMRGGGDPALAAQGILLKPPAARLLVLPATSHIGVVAEAEAVAGFVTPFLDEVAPPIPPGFM